MLKKKQEATQLEKTIDDLIESMVKYEPSDEQYSTCADQLVKLHKLKLDEKRKRVDMNTLLPIIGNIIGILIIVGYERKDVVTSKAMTFLRPLK